MAYSLQYTMAVPLVFFLFFCPTSSAYVPDLLFKLTKKTNLVDAVCSNNKVCAGAVQKLNLRPPTNQQDIIQLGLKVSNLSKEKAREGKAYIDALKKQYPHLNSTLSECWASYDGLLGTYGLIDREFTSDDFSTIDYDLHNAASDNFHCPDDQFIKQGLHASPMTALNNEIMSLTNMLTQVGIMLQGS